MNGWGATPWKPDPFYKHSEVRIIWWWDGCLMFRYERRILNNNTRRKS